MSKNKANADRNISAEPSSTGHRYVMVPVGSCQLLERNPQYLTPRQMDSLKKSIERDGFVVPILVRPTNAGRYEVVSGNHRFMAAQELGYEEVPAVVATLATPDAKRLAINLNLIHGEPEPEQLAPFLAELDDETLGQIHMEDSLRDEVLAFDDVLADRLATLDVPGRMDRESPKSPIAQCRCPTCGKSHIAPSSEE
jgi:ParB-like chromosome segregation protein Spo0J